jgi:hypothetical protein
MSANTNTEGEFARELGETGAGSQPTRQERDGNGGGPSADRRENLSQAGVAHEHGSKTPAADPAGQDFGPYEKTMNNWAANGPSGSAEHQNRPAADPAGYETFYLRFLTLKRVSPHAAHKDHEPKPEHFGLSEREAAFIQLRVEREFNRER